MRTLYMLLILICYPHNALARTVTVEFEGVVTLMRTGSLPLDPFFSIDDRMTGRLTFESNTPGIRAAAPLDTFSYLGSVLDLTFQVGTYSGSLGRGRKTTIRNGVGRIESDLLGFTFGTVESPRFNSLVQENFSMALIDQTGTIFNDAGLPSSPPPLNAFTHAIWRLTLTQAPFQLVSSDISGRITRFTVVPEPRTALLVSLGLGAFASRRPSNTVRRQTGR